MSELARVDLKPIENKLAILSKRVVQPFDFELDYQEPT